MLRTEQTKKRVIAGLSMLLIFAASTFSYAVDDNTDVLRGDVNLDGMADGADITALLAYSTPYEGTSDSGAAEAAQLARYLDGYLSVLPLSNGANLPLTLMQTQDALTRLTTYTFSTVFDACKTEIGSYKLTTYARIASQHTAFEKAAAALNAAFDDAYISTLQVICRDLRQMDIPLLETEKTHIEITWKVAAALYNAFGDDASNAFAASLIKELEVDAEGARFTFAMPDYDDMFSQGTRAQLMTARFTLAYLNTVFADDGTQSVLETPQLSEAYLATIAHPLPGALIKDGWCLPRSNRTRLHMGTDIRANRNTPILSATDGTVLYIGYGAIPGNFVIIRDPYGYEYHYYHMAKLSDFVNEGDTVKQGQQIGLVGSTGNSDANHLHLAIVTPEYYYINPYDVLLQAGIAPIRSGT